MVGAELLFKSLADPTRRAIFESLCLDGRQTVRGLTDRAGISQPAVSKHLLNLKQAGLVRGRVDGRQTHYEARPETLSALVDWTHRMTAFWEGKFDNLEDLLRRTNP